MAIRAKWIPMAILGVLILGAGMLYAQVVQPPKEPAQPTDPKAIYPIPATVPITGRVLTEAGGIPIAGARVLLEAVVQNPVPAATPATGQTGVPATGADGSTIVVRSDPAAPAPVIPTDPKARADASGTVIAPMPPYPMKPEAATDAQGYFTLQAYAGKYTVRIEAPGFEPEYFDNAKEKKDARAIEVRVGMPPVELAIRLKSISTLAGKAVEAGTGRLVTVGTVTAASERTGFRRQGSLTSDGTYLIEGLNEGRYTVQVRARGYLPAAYSKPEMGRDSAIVTVRLRTAVTGIDFALSKGLSFTGRITAADGGVAMAGAIIVASRMNSSVGLEQTAESGTDGSYTMSGLLAGDYLVYAQKPGYAAQFSPGTKNKAEARPVTVAEGKQTPGVDLALSKVGTIFGTVKAGDKPVEGAVVTAYGVAGFGSREVKTDAQGQYIITNLPTADFLVAARARGFALTFHQNTTDRAKARQVRVLSDAHTTGIDITLSPMATIAGTVTGPDGPIAGAQVTLSIRTTVKPMDPVRSDVLYPVPQTVRTAKTGADGAFRIENVEAGTYVIRADAPGFIGEYYDDVRSLDAAKPLVVAASQAVAGIAMKLTALGVLTGKVTAADGKILTGVEVVAFQPAQPRAPVPAHGTVTPAKDGAIPPATQPAPAPGSAAPTREGVTANPGGAVVNPPATDAKGSVVAAAPTSAQPAVVVTRFRGEVNASDGTFRIAGLPAGNYVVQAFAPGYIPLFHGGAETQAQARPLAVKEGDRIDAGAFKLVKGGAIGGFALADGDGKPVQGGTVTAQILGDGAVSTKVGNNGAFRVDGLRDGKYLLKVEASGFIAEFYNDTRQPDKATLIEIKGGSEVTGLIIGLARQSTVDFNGDGVVDLGDLFMFAQGFGQRKGMSGYNAGMDLNGDGAIGLEDFFLLASEFSKMGRAGKPAATAAGRFSLTRVAAPPGLLAVRLDLEAADLTGYTAAFDFDRAGLAFVGAERPDGTPVTASATPDGIFLAGRAEGPISVTLHFRASGEVNGPLVTPKMVTLIGADGAMRLLDVGDIRADGPPKAFRLTQNSPNPFNPATQIAFEVPAEGPVRLEVYNLLGQRVRILLEERRTAGRHVATWDGRDEMGRPAGTGIYLYRLTAPGFAQTRKMMLLR